MSPPDSLRIAYLGPPGTHSHAAARSAFPPNNSSDTSTNSVASASTTFLPFNGFPDILKSLFDSNASFALLPIANNRSGAVTLAMDALIDAVQRGGQGEGGHGKKSINVLGDVLLPVDHCLLSNTELIVDKNGVSDNNGVSEPTSKSTSTPLSSYLPIKRVYSHNEALAQCSKFLSTHLPHAEQIRVSSTARAAELASKEEGAAAIANEVCEEVYGIKMLERAIQDARDNTTRFLVLSVSSTPTPPHLSSQPSPTSSYLSFALLLPKPYHQRSEEQSTTIIGTSGYQLNLALTETMAVLVEKKAGLRNIWTRPYVEGASTVDGTSEAGSGKVKSAASNFRSWLLVEFSTAGEHGEEIAKEVMDDLKTKGACEKVYGLGGFFV